MMRTTRRSQGSGPRGIVANIVDIRTLPIFELHAEMNGHTVVELGDGDFAVHTVGDECLGDEVEDVDYDDVDEDLNVSNIHQNHLISRVDVFQDPGKAVDMLHT